MEESTAVSTAAEVVEGELVGDGVALAPSPSGRTDIQETPAPSFRYDDLDEETQGFLKGEAETIRQLWRTTAESIVRIGISLIKVKERLKHGQYEAWVETEFGWSKAAARRFVQVANVFKDHINIVPNLSQSALYLLAQTKTPETLRNQVLALAEEKSVSYKYVRELLSGQLTPPPTKKGKPTKARSWTNLDRKGRKKLYNGDPSNFEFINEVQKLEPIDNWLAYPPVEVEMKSLPHFLANFRLVISSQDLERNHGNNEVESEAERHDIENLAKFLDKYLRNSLWQERKVVVTYLPKNTEFMTQLLLTLKDSQVDFYIADPELDTIKAAHTIWKSLSKPR